MNIGIVDCWSSRVSDISRIASKLGYENEVILMQDLTKKKWLCKWDFSRFDGIIISGSPTTLTDENKQEYLRLFPFIWEIDIPILWICFGHQLIGHVMWAGYCIWNFIDWNTRIHILNPDEKLFKWIKSWTQFKENHEEHILLPPDFLLLADSNNCRNEAMKHTSKDIYWVQFHPEVSGEGGERLLRNFLEICK